MNQTPQQYPATGAVRAILARFPGATQFEVERLFDAKNELTIYLALSNDLTQSEVSEHLATIPSVATSVEATALKAA